MAILGSTLQGLGRYRVACMSFFHSPAKVVLPLW